MSAADLSIVCLCTGNRFRSPLAEALLRSRLDGLPVTVSSYGTADLPSGPAFSQAERLGAALGVDLADHRSRPLAGVDLSGADLVIGFEAIHTATAVVESGSPRDRAFTLPDLAEYLSLVERRPGSDPLELAREAVRQAAELRRAGGRPQREIPDPVGGPERGYEEAARRIADLVAIVAARLFPRATPPVG